MGLLATRQAGAIKKGGSGSEIRWNQLQDPSSSIVSWHLEQMSSWSLSFLICKKTVRFHSQGCYVKNNAAKVPAHSRCSKNTDSCPVFVAIIKGSEAHCATLLNNSKIKIKNKNIHLINIPHSHYPLWNLQGEALFKTDPPSPTLEWGFHPVANRPQMELDRSHVLLQACSEQTLQLSQRLIWWTDLGSSNDELKVYETLGRTCNKALGKEGGELTQGLARTLHQSVPSSCPGSGPRTSWWVHQGSNSGILFPTTLLLRDEGWGVF